MAGVVYSFTSGNVALGAGVESVMISIAAPTNQRVILRRLEFMGKAAAGGADTPVRVRLIRGASAGAGGTALTVAPVATLSQADPIPAIGKINTSDAETIQSSLKTGTAIPGTPTDVGYSWDVNPQLGAIEQFPLGERFEIPGGTVLAIMAISIATPTIMITGLAEE